MEFSTPIVEWPRLPELTYQDAWLMIGSCFAENIGNRLLQSRFRATVNPTGIVYNPLAMARVLELLLQERRLVADDLWQTGSGIWGSPWHHGRFSDADPERCLQRINESLAQGSRALRQARVLCITWGTAWAYTHIERNVVVANCHKLPEKAFRRERLTVEEIVACYRPLLQRIRAENPGVAILFTVSPIRHWKEGAHGNQLSKATLLLAIDRLRQEFPETAYFPAYELVLDELRDYRFYGPDMLHLSETAVDYIWEKFSGVFFSPETRETMRQVQRIEKGLSHRPFNATSAAYREHLLGLQEQLDALAKRDPDIDLSNDRLLVERELSGN